ncbi:dTDP-4-dehydrorhamnose reductase [Flavobacterium microcysteis]
MKKILITGANGQLGSEIKVLSPLFPDFDFVFADRSEFSLESESETLSFLEETKAEYLVNCAAYTAVDKAETEVELADLVNHKAVGLLAKWSFENNCKLVHISTDYVFEGTSEIPLKENDQTNPQNEYGRTKLLGEIVCQENNPESIIIRTSWVYSEFGANFVKTMLRLMGERESISVVNDQIGSPTYAKDLAEAIFKIIEAENWHPGIYNFSNEGEISWFEFALAIKEISGSSCDVKGIPSEAYPTPAKRPAYSLLDKTKIKEVYKINIPDYKSSLEKCLNNLSKKI